MGKSLYSLYTVKKKKKKKKKKKITKTKNVHFNYWQQILAADALTTTFTGAGRFFEGITTFCLLVLRFYGPVNPML